MNVLRRVLRALLLSLLIAFAVGFGIGSWLRCRMERPPTYIGDATAHEAPRPQVALGTSVQ